jgi:hypothetical protein
LWPKTFAGRLVYDEQNFFVFEYHEDFELEEQVNVPCYRRFILIEYLCLGNRLGIESNLAYLQCT